MSQQKTLQKMEAKEIGRYEKDKFYQRCLVKWLKGYSIDHIAQSEGNVSTSSILTAIRAKRAELRESQEAEIADLAAERIGGLRQLQQEAHEYLDFLPEKAPQLLTVALRAEESIAKIQGVLSDKVLHLGRIQHEVKYYDFTDKTPDPFIVEGTSTLVLEEPELPILVNTEPIYDTQVVEVAIPEPPKPKVVPPLRIETSVGGYLE